MIYFRGDDVFWQDRPAKVVMVRRDRVVIQEIDGLEGWRWLFSNLNPPMIVDADLLDQHQRLARAPDTMINRYHGHG